jgi:hypothetical protein
MNIDIEQLSAKWLIQVLLSKKTLTQTDDITVIMNDIASDDVHEQNQSLQNDRKLCDAESLCVITPTNPKTPVELNDLEASLLPSTDASVAVASDSDCTDNPSVNSTQYSIGFKKGLAPVDFIFRRLSLAPDYLTLSRYESYEETESFKVGSLWAGSRFLGYGTSDKDGTPSSIAEPIRHIVVYSTCIVLCLFDAGNIFRIETDTSNTNHAALMHIIKHIGVPIVFIPKADNIAEELSLSSTSENPWTDTRVSTPDTTKSKDTILTEQQNRRIENDDIVDERTYSLANESTNKEQEDTEFIFWSIVFSVAAVSAWLLYLFASTALSLGWHVLEFFFRKGLSLS